MEAFKDDDCSKKLTLHGEDSNSHTLTDDELKALDDVCNDTGSKSYHTSCQAGQGVVFRSYDNDDCKPLREKKTVVPWDSCHKFPHANFYVKVTGAMAIKSAALALAAFAGSQF